MDFRLVESVGLVSLIFTENYIEILRAYLFVFLIDRVWWGDGVPGFFWEGMYGVIRVQLG